MSDHDVLDPLHFLRDPRVRPFASKAYFTLFQGASPQGPAKKDLSKAADSFKELAASMVEPETGPLADGTVSRDNAEIPAAYTYLGQFVSHDLTFDSRTLPGEPYAEKAGKNLRTPALDLDSIYGRDPWDRAFLFQGSEHGPYEFHLGRAFFDERRDNVAEPDLPRLTAQYARVARRYRPDGRSEFVASVYPKEGDVEGPHPEVVALPVPEEDVVWFDDHAYVRAVDSSRVCTEEGWRSVSRSTVRTLGGRALVGDPRNDQNVIVAQLQLAFLRFHNAAVERVAEDSPQGTPKHVVFSEARRLVRWHYQWMVLNDFLRRIVGRDQWVDPADPEALDGFRKVLGKKELPSGIPKEFALAVFRFGHSMVRPAYRLNDLPPAREIPLFAEKALHEAAKRPAPKAHLGGGRSLPDRWTVQWDRFLPIGGSDAQMSRRIDDRLAGPVARFSIPLEGRGEVPLPFVTLFRGWEEGLASGQAAARALGLEPLAPRHGGEEDPLWIYVLREASEIADGAHLGPLGATIVRETLIKAVLDDGSSYLRAGGGGSEGNGSKAAWRPTWGEEEGEFTLEDLLRVAGAPTNEEDVRHAVYGRPHTEMESRGTVKRGGLEPEKAEQL